MPPNDIFLWSTQRSLAQLNYPSTDKDTFRTHMPHIDAELHEVLSVLNDLEIQLSVIHTQAVYLRCLYDSARVLVGGEDRLPW
jgi:hypothetical protein